MITFLDFRKNWNNGYDKAHDQVEADEKLVDVAATWLERQKTKTQMTNKNTLHHSDFFEAVFIKVHSAAIYLQFLMTFQNDYYTLQSHSRVL